MRSTEMAIGDRIYRRTWAGQRAWEVQAPKVSPECWKVLGCSGRADRGDAAEPRVSELPFGIPSEPGENLNPLVHDFLRQPGRPHEGGPSDDLVHIRVAHFGCVWHVRQFGQSCRSDEQRAQSIRLDLRDDRGRVVAGEVHLAGQHGSGYLAATLVVNADGVILG